MLSTEFSEVGILLQRQPSRARSRGAEGRDTMRAGVGRAVGRAGMGGAGERGEGKNGHRLSHQTSPLPLLHFQVGPK